MTKIGQDWLFFDGSMTIPGAKWSWDDLRHNQFRLKMVMKRLRYNQSLPRMVMEQLRHNQSWHKMVMG
jgi:hypothetical protein